MNDGDILERLETKLAFLERANAELSDVVYRQQQEITALTERFAMLVGQFDALKVAERPYTLEEERPPHY